jgi:transcriptional regulator with XRE-family HTH domain
MDPRNDIREFLVSRRARITPGQAGLPAYGTNRRVKGLRREEVALLAGISAEYYVRLERGNMGGVSEDVLDGIARALHLDEAERMHLFDLARAANAAPNRRMGRRPSQERVRPVVQLTPSSPSSSPCRRLQTSPKRRRPVPRHRLCHAFGWSSCGDLNPGPLDPSHIPTVLRDVD